MQTAQATKTELTVAQIQSMIADARIAAAAAAESYYTEVLGGRDSMPCGFAWVKITGFNGERIRGNTKLGRALKAAGVDDLMLWDPSGHYCQNVDTKKSGAKAAATVLKQYGFDAVADSRWD